MCNRRAGSKLHTMQIARQYPRFGRLLAALAGVSEEPCKADRKDWSCLHLLPFIKIRIVV
jgi:hypothetical protein